MVAKHNHDIIDVGIEVIHSYRIINARETITPTATIILQCLADSFLYWKIHHGLEVAVKAVVVLNPRLPVCYCRSRTCPTLSYDIEIWVLIHNGLYPFATRNHFNIWVSIYTQTIEVSVFNPPNSPLLEVLEKILILQIHIRHRTIKPTSVR